MRRKDSDSVGRLGEHFVDEICTHLRFRWREQKEKSYAGDGIIEVFGKGAREGDLIWVEVKTGRGKLSHITKTHYVVKVDKNHTNYWIGLELRLATILVWYDPIKRIAFWTQVTRESVNVSGSSVRIPKSSRFGLHSAGDLKALCARTYRPTSRFRTLNAPDLPGKLTESIKNRARAFYDEWRGEYFTAPAHGHVTITLSGWRHLTAVSRSQADIARRLELIPVARLMLSSIPTRTRVRWLPETDTAYYMQTANIKFKHRADALVSVITKEVEGQDTTFESVFEHVRRD